MLNHHTSLRPQGLRKSTYSVLLLVKHRGQVWASPEGAGTDSARGRSSRALEMASAGRCAELARASQAHLASGVRTNKHVEGAESSIQKGGSECIHAHAFTLHWQRIKLHATLGQKVGGVPCNRDGRVASSWPVGGQGLGRTTLRASKQRGVIGMEVDLHRHGAPGSVGGRGGRADRVNAKKRRPPRHHRTIATPVDPTATRRSVFRPDTLP